MRCSKKASIKDHLETVNTQHSSVEESSCNAEGKVVNDLMEILSRGHGELLAWHDPDEQRQWIARNKMRSLEDKRMTAAEAVDRFVPDGCYLASGGFGHVRVGMAAIYVDI
jgi:hypothetical protein